MSHPAYALAQPETRTTSVIFASPHSGRDYTDAFLRLAVLDAETIRSSEDAFVVRGCAEIWCPVAVGKGSARLSGFESWS